MLFNSLAFLAFFGVVLVVLPLAPLPVDRAQGLARSAPGTCSTRRTTRRSCCYLWFTRCSRDWFVACGIHAARRTPGRRKLLLVGLSWSTSACSPSSSRTVRRGQPVAALAALTGSGSHPAVPSLEVPLSASRSTRSSRWPTPSTSTGAASSPRRGSSTTPWFVAFFPLLVAGGPRPRRALPAPGRRRAAGERCASWAGACR